MRRTITITALALLIAASAQAQRPQAGSNYNPQSGFTMGSRNRDGSVTTYNFDSGDWNLGTANRDGSQNTWTIPGNRPQPRQQQPSQLRGQSGEPEE